MYAMLLNPPKRRRRRARNKISKACRRHVIRAAHRRRRKRWSPERKKAWRSRKMKRIWRKRKAKKAGASKKKGVIAAITQAFKGTKSDPMNALPAHYAANPRRRRARRGRRGRRMSRNYSHWIPAYSTNPSWVPSYAMNPSVAGVMGTATQAFSKNKLMYAGSAVLGAVANTTAINFVSPYLPSVLQKGLGGAAVSLASAGLMSAAVAQVSPRFAAPMFVGGMFMAVKKLADAYVLPALGLSGCCGNIGNYAASMLTTPYLPDYSENDLSPFGYNIDSVATEELSS